MHCLMCGNKLPSDADTPICAYCQRFIAKNVMHEDTAWTLGTALDVLINELNNLKKQLKASAEKKTES